MEVVKDGFLIEGRTLDRLKWIVWSRKKSDKKQSSICCRQRVELNSPTLPSVKQTD